MVEFNDREADVPDTQFTDVNAPQLPLKSCNRTPAEENAEPMLLKLIVVFEARAVKLYHTSPPGVPAQVLDTAGVDAVEPASVPAVFEQVELGASVVALLQRSLEGGS